MDLFSVFNPGGAVPITAFVLLAGMPTANRAIAGIAQLTRVTRVTGIEPSPQ